MSKLIDVEKIRLLVKTMYSYGCIRRTSDFDRLLDIFNNFVLNFVYEKSIRNTTHKAQHFIWDHKFQKMQHFQCMLNHNKPDSRKLLEKYIYAHTLFKYFAN